MYMYTNVHPACGLRPPSLLPEGREAPRAVDAEAREVGVREARGLLALGRLDDLVEGPEREHAGWPLDLVAAGLAGIVAVRVVDRAKHPLDGGAGERGELPGPGVQRRVGVLDAEVEVLLREQRLAEPELEPDLPEARLAVEVLGEVQTLAPTAARGRRRRVEEDVGARAALALERVRLRGVAEVQTRRRVHGELHVRLLGRMQVVVLLDGHLLLRRRLDLAAPITDPREGPAQRRAGGEQEDEGQGQVQGVEPDVERAHQQQRRAGGEQEDEEQGLTLNCNNNSMHYHYHYDYYDCYDHCYYYY